MPTLVITRVNPLDLQGNIAIGVSLPFNGLSGPFNSTYSTQEQTKSNLINLLLTNKGERIMNPEFGCDLKTILFEGITEDINEDIKNLIQTNVGLFIPNVEILDIIINNNPYYNNQNVISIIVKYKMKISQEADQVTVQFI